MYYDEDGRMYRREILHAREIPEIDEGILIGNPLDRIYESSLDHALYTLMIGVLCPLLSISDDLASTTRAPMSSTRETPPTSRLPLGSDTPRPTLPSSTLDSPRLRVLDQEDVTQPEKRMSALELTPIQESHVSIDRSQSLHSAGLSQSHITHIPHI